MQTEKKKSLNRVYIAGPDLFRTDGKEIGYKKKAIQAEYGLTAYYGFDNPIEDDYLAELDSQKEAGKEPTPEQMKARTDRVAMIIAKGHENEMKTNACCAIINCSPYRGPSMDVGTVYELGFLRALGKPCFGFTNVAANFNIRSRAHMNITDEKIDIDENGNRFEEFHTMDNLMIDFGINDSVKPFKLVVPEKDISDVNDHGSTESLALFRKCAEQIVEWNKMYAE